MKTVIILVLTIVFLSITSSSHADVPLQAARKYVLSTDKTLLLVGLSNLKKPAYEVGFFAGIGNACEDTDLLTESKDFYFDLVDSAISVGLIAQLSSDALDKEERRGFEVGSKHIDAMKDSGDFYPGLCADLASDFSTTRSKIVEQYPWIGLAGC